MEIKITASMINSIGSVIYRFVLARIFSIVAASFTGCQIEQIMVGVTIAYAVEIVVLLRDYYT